MPALRISSRICSRKRLGVPESRAISSMRKARPGPARSSESTINALSAYFIFWLITPSA